MSCTAAQLLTGEIFLKQFYYQFQAMIYQGDLSTGLTNTQLCLTSSCIIMFQMLEVDNYKVELVSGLAKS